MLRTFIDGSIGGVERYYLARREKLVIVPDIVRKCVGFIYARSGQGEVPFGTVFFVSLPCETFEGKWVYAVTAKHVIEGIRQQSIDGNVLLRLNRRGGGVITVDTAAADWVVHPTDSIVDVAVGAIDLPSDADYLTYPIWESCLDHQLIQEHEVGTGDEVFITGLFVNHTGKQSNVPIVRIGNIAAMPGEPIDTQMGPMEAYLIESRSIGGLSGSPVFVNLGLVRSIRGEIRKAQPNLPYQTIFYLLGLTHGHFDVTPMVPPVTKEKINMGIAIVPPVWKILEVIDQESEREMRKKTEERARKKTLPSMDAAVSDKPLTAEGFENVLKQVSRKLSSPDREKKGT